jgi:hypothetical protein
MEGAETEAEEAAAKKMVDGCLSLLHYAQAKGETILVNFSEKLEFMEKITQQSREASESEKAAMEKGTKVLSLNVGGKIFKTSLETLLSVPGTKFETMFSGHSKLTPNAKGTYFIDRDGTQFRLILNYLRDSGTVKLDTSDMGARQRKALAVEVKFYGLLDRMMPYHAQDVIGESLLRHARLTGKHREQQTAVDQACALVFEIRSTTPFVTDEFQDLRFVITDRVVNRSPVWAAVGGKHFMYRDVSNRMSVSNKQNCAEGKRKGPLFNKQKFDHIVAPTELPPDKWMSSCSSTLESQYASAKRSPGSTYTYVPEMRITVVHGLDEGNPEMVLALQQLAAHDDDDEDDDDDDDDNDDDA